MRSASCRLISALPVVFRSGYLGPQQLARSCSTSGDMVVGTPCEDIGGLKFLKGEPCQVPVPGQVTVVELWAKWCGPCRAIFPHLTQIYKDRKAKGLAVVGISTEDTPDLQAFVDKEGDKMGYTVAADASGDVGRLMSRANVTGIPHAFVVGRDGKILYSGHPGQPEFVKAVDGALKAPKAAEKKALPLITATREELAAMSIRDLKAILTERHLSFADLNEKAELVTRILEQCTSVTYYA